MTDSPTKTAEQRTSEVEAELAEWVSGKRSWCDQHHGMPDEIELTARADEATIRLLIAKRAALAVTGTLASGAPSEEQIEAARLATHRVLASKWAVIAVALKMDQGQYDSFLGDIARAALTAAGVGSPIPAQVDLETALRFCTCSHWLEAHHERACLEEHCACRSFSPVVQVSETKAKALEEAAAHVPFPADPYGGFDHESLRGAHTQMKNWLRDRADMLRGGAQ